MRNSILCRLAWTLVLPICCLQVNKSLLSVEEGDWGSGDPVINDIQRVNLYGVTPDDNESSGDDGEDPDTDVISGGGSGNGEGSGSGEDPIGNVTAAPHYKTYIPVNTTARMDTINDLDRNGTTTQRTNTETTTTKPTEILIVTKLGNIVENPVDPNDNDTVIMFSDNDSLPSVGDEDDDNNGVNFTVAIIVGVVVGAMLSVLIIVCLVFRLRKKDEGSYSLEEPSTAMLRNDTESPTTKGT